MNKDDLGIFIGRFSPYHSGHHHVVTEALKHADNLVILVGSARSPRSYRVPFNFQERRDMIEGSLPAELKNRVRVLPLEDATYNDSKWIHNVQTLAEIVTCLEGDFVLQQQVRGGRLLESFDVCVCARA